jgi:hypothetical protein
MTYGRPGVFINETLLPAAVTANPGANAAGAVIGVFSKGPSNTPTLVSSWYEFVQNFGGYDNSYLATFGVGQFFQNGGSDLYVVRALHSDAVKASAKYQTSAPADRITFTAVNAGVDGNNLRVKLVSTGVTDYYNLVITKETAASSSDTDYTNDIVVETFYNVVYNSSTSVDYLPTVVNGVSKYVTVAVSGSGSAVIGSNPVPLTSGSDGSAVTLEDFKTALNTLDQVQVPLVIFAPEVNSSAVLGNTDGASFVDYSIAWAGTRNHFVLAETDAGKSVSDAISYSSARVSAATGGVGLSQAAVYYPHYYIVDPLGRSSSSLRLVGPVGAVAGQYISTDVAYGPFKAPAGVNTRFTGALALEIALTPTNLDTLNSGSRPVNAIRNLPGSGVVIMGARTLKQDNTPNKYVNMRRSLIYIKKRLEDLTQFAVFENNNEDLWARLRTTVTVFLNEYRNQGGLRGTPAQAFFVKVDAENNTTQTIANGEVHIEVGVALQYPAEFVVINLSQKTVN